MSTIVHIPPANLPVTHARGGAIERRVLELARAQTKRGNRVIVYSADAVNSSVCADGIELRQVACRQSLALRAIELARAALRQLRTEHVDVLHFHSVPEGAVLARGMHVSTFLSYDNFHFRRGRATPLFWLYRRMLSHFDTLLPVSEYCRRESLAYWRLSGSKAQVLYNGVNLGQFAPDPVSGRALRASLGIGNAPVILYVGRICEQKGTDVLLNACGLLKSRMPQVQLVLAGPSLRFGNHGASDLTQRIHELGGIYLGAVEEAQLSAVFNLADIFVMPTRRDEMFGMAAVEAQACGKPVVCSRHGGLVEVISQKSGMFFPVGDHAALAECLAALIDNRDLYNRLAGAARENAARFAWNALAADLECRYGTAAAHIAAV